MLLCGSIAFDDGHRTDGTPPRDLNHIMVERFCARYEDKKCLNNSSTANRGEWRQAVVLISLLCW